MNALLSPLKELADYEEIIKNRKRGLCMLAKRLNMEYKELYQNIENIS